MFIMKTQEFKTLQFLNSSGASADLIVQSPHYGVPVVLKFIISVKP
jgi:hypothetical protein